MIQLALSINHIRNGKQITSQQRKIPTYWLKLSSSNPSHEDEVKTMFYNGCFITTACRIQ